VKEFFKRLLSLTITRNASGYAALSGLQVKFVHDPIADRMDDEAGWSLVTKVDDIKLKPAEIVVAFSKVSKKDAESLMEDITAEMARAREMNYPAAELRGIKTFKDRKASVGPYESDGRCGPASEHIL
jgi:hypothetical protein